MTTFDAIGTWWLFESVRPPGQVVPGFGLATTEVAPTEAQVDRDPRPEPPLQIITPPR